MRLRRPRFALILTLLLAVVAGVLALTIHGSGTPPGGTVSTPPNGKPTRACVSSRASITVVLHSNASARFEVHLPVSVTAEALSGTRLVSATRAQTIVETATAQRPVAIRQTTVVSARACARGSSAQAAHGEALSRAYAVASARARSEALATARNRVKALIASLIPGELAKARASATARANAAAAALRPRLEQEAKAAAAAAATRHR